MEKNKIKKSKVTNNKTDNKFSKSLKEYIKFYNNNFKKKHIIVYIILLIIFFITLSLLISNHDTSDIIQQMANEAGNVKNTNLFTTIFKVNIPFIFLTFFAGITPFVPLSIIGAVYPYTAASNIASAFTMTSHTGNLIFMTIGSIIEIFAIALAIEAGLYYCKLSTKKFRYSQGGSFGIYDVKKQLYNISNKKEKLEKLEEKKYEKEKKREKLNVKVPYKMLFYTFVVCVVISTIGILISAL